MFLPSLHDDCILNRKLSLYSGWKWSEEQEAKTKNNQPNKNIFLFFSKLNYWYLSYIFCSIYKHKHF